MSRAGRFPMRPQFPKPLRQEKAAALGAIPLIRIHPKTVVTVFRRRTLSSSEYDLPFASKEPE